jgi:hypothetical protein
MAETLDVLKKLGKSVARGVPQLATGFVDLAALPLTMTGVRKPEQIFGSTAYLTDKGLLPQPQTGLLNEGAELASSMLNPAAAAKGATVGLLGTFIGKGSKLWNAESNSIAKALEKEGLAPETIWSQTGNVKAPDGKWRQEIADTNIDIMPNYKKAIKDYGVRKQQSILSHPKLYNAYPELKDTYMQQLRASEVASGTKGSAGNNTIELNFSKDPKNELLSTALHENQHLIQDIENMGRGGSPSLFSKDMQEKVSWANQQVAEKNAQMNETYKMLEQARANKFNDPSAEKRIEALKNRYDTLLNEKLSYVKDAQLDPKEEAFKQYQRLLGEAEARLTQSRIPLTQEQRLQYYPYTEGQYGLDVPYGELVVQGLLK